MNGNGGRHRRAHPGTQLYRPSGAPSALMRPGEQWHTTQARIQRRPAVAPAVTCILNNHSVSRALPFAASYARTPLMSSAVIFAEGLSNCRLSQLITAGG